MKKNKPKTPTQSKPKTSECGGGMSRESYFEPTEQTLDLVIGEWLMLHHGNTGMTESNVNKLKQLLREWMRAKINKIDEYKWYTPNSDAHCGYQVALADVKRALGMD